MIIDFHTHIFPEKIAEKTIDTLAKNCDGKAYFNGKAEGLIEQMEKADVDVCVNLPVLTKPSQFDSVARFAIEINEKYLNSKRRIISFAGMHPACEDIKGKMRFLKDNGIRGIKIHPDYQGTFFDDDGYVNILKCAKDNDMIVVTHAGVDDGYKGCLVKCPPELSYNVIKRVNYSKIVLGHYGGHKQWEKVLDLLCGLDVYFDTAFTFHEINEELFKKILEKHGEDKVLFATDCPWRDIKDDKDILNSYGLGKNVLDKIFYKNAQKLLNLGE